MNNQPKIPVDILDQLLLDGKINLLQYVMNGPMVNDFLEWCETHNVYPKEECAELYYDMTHIDMEEHAFMENEVDGYWY